MRDLILFLKECLLPQSTRVLIHVIIRFSWQYTSLMDSSLVLLPSQSTVVLNHVLIRNFGIASMTHGLAPRTICGDRIILTDKYYFKWTAISINNVIFFYRSYTRSESMNHVYCHENLIITWINTRVDYGSKHFFLTRARFFQIYMCLACINSRITNLARMELKSGDNANYFKKYHISHDSVYGLS